MLVQFSAAHGFKSCKAAFSNTPNEIRVNAHIIMENDVTHSIDLNPRQIVAILQCVRELSCFLTDCREAISCQIAFITIGQEHFDRHRRQPPLNIGDQLQDEFQPVGITISYPHQNTRI